jgi:hypothetical protein
MQYTHGGKYSVIDGELHKHLRGKSGGYLMESKIVKADTVQVEGKRYKVSHFAYLLQNGGEIPKNHAVIRLNPRRGLKGDNLIVVPMDSLTNVDSNRCPVCHRLHLTD